MTKLNMNDSKLSLRGKLSGFMLMLPLTLFFGCGSDPVATTSSSTVILTLPANLDTGVPISRAITATFSEAMSSSTLTANTFTLTQGGTAVSGTVSYVGTTATFKPSANLAVSLPFVATITTGARDVSGHALASAFTWSFTSGSTADVTAPTLVSTYPVDTATGVPINRAITATFSESMDLSTLTATTFTVTQGGTAVSGTVTSVGATATFTPSANLASSLPFVATVTTGVKDLSGNALASNSTWSFTTGSTVAAGQSPVSLGTAGNFAILAKSGIDTVPTSAITGNIGVSPIDSTAITGFGLTMDGTGVFATSSQVTGNVYAASYGVPTPSNLTTAISNMETAYVDAAGRTTPDFTELGAGDISGKTLTPGLYKWGTSLSINSDVTLTGGPNDVWIFQIAGGITQANGTHVTLAGGALAKNIFWQSFGSVAIGTTAHFEGVILSKTSITLNTGASINGRLLAQTAVTLKSSTVTQP